MYFSWHRPCATRPDRILSIALPVTAFLSVNALLAAGAFTSNPTWFFAALIPTIIATQLLMVALLRKEQRRAKAVVEAADFKICPRCRYSLKGLDDQGDCPECGRRYSQDELRRTWTAAYELAGADSTATP